MERCGQNAAKSNADGTNVNTLDADQNPTLIQTYEGSKLSVPTWKNGAVSLGGSFPKLEGTPNAIYADAAMTQPITEPIKIGSFLSAKFMIQSLNCIS